MLITTTRRPISDPVGLRWLSRIDNKYYNVKRGPVAVPSTSGKERSPELFSKDLRRTHLTSVAWRAGRGIFMHVRAMTKGPHILL